MPSCMSCKYVDPLLLTHPAVCSARLSACESAGPGSATYLVHVAAAAYFVCLTRRMIRRSLLQEQDQAGLVLVVCEVCGPLLLALSAEALFRYGERSW